MTTKKSKGQASVEYVLMLLVVVILINTVMRKVNEYLVGDGNNSLIAQFQKKYKESLGVTFRSFPLRGYRED